MIKHEDKYLGHGFCVGSPNGNIDNLLLLGLLLDLPTSFLFLDLLHGLLRGRGFYDVGPHRDCRSWGPGRDRFLATGLDLRSWKTPGGCCRDWRVIC